LGTVLSARIPTERETGRRRGFGFVQMNDREARLAIESLNATVFMGRTLIVNEARERPPREPFVPARSSR
jgi:RNA recognition motif-containing protein